MPDALREKMLGSLNFLSAYALGENLAATSVDLAWHCLSPSEVPTAEEAPAFEKKVLADMGLLNNQIPSTLLYFLLQPHLGRRIRCWLL